jgi:predicted nucleotidyltransferase
LGHCQFKRRCVQRTKKKLIETENFSTTKNPLKLLSPDNIEVDLIPFDYHETPHFIGLREIFLYGTQRIILDDGLAYQVATLPAIVLLKLIAWDNNPDTRGKDVEDIAYILDKFDIYTNDSYELFTELAPEFISARTIGRKIKDITASSLDIQEKVIQIIVQQIEKSNTNGLIRIMINKSDKTEEFVINQFKELIKGIKENSTQQ